jgi:hypothetical protein
MMGGWTVGDGAVLAGCGALMSIPGDGMVATLGVGGGAGLATAEAGALAFDAAVTGGSFTKSVSNSTSSSAGGPPGAAAGASPRESAGGAPSGAGRRRIGPSGGKGATGPVPGLVSGLDAARASSSEMILRMDARMSSIDGSCWGLLSLMRLFPFYTAATRRVT